MKIKIIKNTPYRHNYQREIKIGEIHEVTRIRNKNILQPEKAYFFIVDGVERMVLESDCIVLEGVK